MAEQVGRTTCSPGKGGRREGWRGRPCEPYGCPERVNEVWRVKHAD